MCDHRISIQRLELSCKIAQYLYPSKSFSNNRDRRGEAAPGVNENKPTNLTAETLGYIRRMQDLKEVPLVVLRFLFFPKYLCGWDCCSGFVWVIIFPHLLRHLVLWSEHFVIFIRLMKYQVDTYYIAEVLKILRCELVSCS